MCCLPMNTIQYNVRSPHAGRGLAMIACVLACLPASSLSAMPFFFGRGPRARPEGSKTSSRARGRPRRPPESAKEAKGVARKAAKDAQNAMKLPGQFHDTTEKLKAVARIGFARKLTENEQLKWLMKPMFAGVVSAVAAPAALFREEGASRDKVMAERADLLARLVLRLSDNKIPTDVAQREDESAVGTAQGPEVTAARMVLSHIRQRHREHMVLRSRKIGDRIAPIVEGALRQPGSSQDADRLFDMVEEIGPTAFPTAPFPHHEMLIPTASKRFAAALGRIQRIRATPRRTGARSPLQERAADLFRTLENLFELGGGPASDRRAGSGPLWSAE